MYKEFKRIKNEKFYNLSLECIGNKLIDLAIERDHWVEGSPYEQVNKICEVFNYLFGNLWRAEVDTTINGYDQERLILWITDENKRIFVRIDEARFNGF